MVTLTQLLLWAMWLSDYIEECYWSIYLGFSVVHCVIKLHLYLRSQPSHTRCATGQFSTPTPCRWLNLGMSITPLSTCPNKKKYRSMRCKTRRMRTGQWWRMKLHHLFLVRFSCFCWSQLNFGGEFLLNIDTREGSETSSLYIYIYIFVTLHFLYADFLK